MRIIEIIPIPFFSERGTGFSTLNRTRVMSEEGHAVDIVTLPFGKDICLKNVTIHRVAKIPFFRQVKMGPSWAKLAYNMLLFLKAFMMMIRNHYDCLHLHGESVYYGLILKYLFSVKILHDLHNSMPVDYINYKPDASPILIKILAQMERLALKHSDVVIVICPELKKTIEKISPNNVVTINNFCLKPDIEIKEEDVNLLRNELGVQTGEKLITYAGSFGSNQSLEILLDAIPLIKAEIKNTKYLLVGGDQEGIDRLKQIPANLSSGNDIIFKKKKPLNIIWLYMMASDVLISAMTRGRNVPSKVYSYMGTGKPIVVTDAVPHTQVVDNTMAMIAQPNPISFANAIVTLLRNDELSNRISGKALEEVKEKYSYQQFFRSTKKALDMIKMRKTP